MRTLILTPDRNHKLKDFTGEFRPESLKAQALTGGVIERIDCSRKDRQLAVLRAIREHSPERLVMICHGFPKKVQFGFRVGSSAFADLCDTMKKAGVQSVILLACLTGQGPGSFAETLAQRTGAAVLAHYTKGVATTNPALIFFDPLPSVYTPGSPEIRRARARLKADPSEWPELLFVDTKQKFDALFLCTQTDSDFVKLRG